ncbi:MAG: hypothetical protein K2X47_01590 [Bdellovibrionales bacterium]|nr:hypothetical protein [Bdellovibrionales bacterium]
MIKKFIHTLWTIAVLGSLALMASGFIKKNQPLVLQETKELSRAQKALFKLTREELRVKSEIESLKKQNRLKFEQALENTLENSTRYQSYLFEIRDGRKKVESAKVIAKHHMYQAIQKNWEDLKLTVMNSNGATSWKTFEPDLRLKIDEVVYTPMKRTEKGAEQFGFNFRDWGQVVVTRPKKGAQTLKWVLTVNSNRDGIETPAGLDQIQVADELK